MSIYVHVYISFVNEVIVWVSMTTNRLQIGSLQIRQNYSAKNPWPVE